MVIFFCFKDDFFFRFHFSCIEKLRRTHLNCCLISLVLAAVVDDGWGWMVAVEWTADMAAIDGFPMSMVIMMELIASDFPFQFGKRYCCFSFPLLFILYFFLFFFLFAYLLQPNTDTATASASSSSSPSTTDLLNFRYPWNFFAMNNISKKQEKKEKLLFLTLLFVCLYTNFFCFLYFTCASQHFYAGFRQDFNTNWKLIETSPMCW